jgi:hypothetical protein
MTTLLSARLVLRTAYVACRLLALALLLLSMPTISRGQLINGNFETGDLTGWTVFNDTDGSAGNPTVVLFDTAGSGVPAFSPQFNVGETIQYPEGGLGAGGGILQNVNLGAGQLTIGLYIASSTTSPNGDAGTFELLLDGGVVDSYAFGSIGSYGSVVTERSTLGYTGVISAGEHQIAIDFRRGWNASAATPHQYLNNITLSVTNSPPPQLLPPSLFYYFIGSNIFLTWSGIAGHTYQAQCATSLAPPNWVDLGNANAGISGMMYASEVVGLTPQQFYRVVVLH